MCRKIIYSVSFILVLVLMCGVGRADVTVAEDLLVDLRAEELPYGQGVTTWTNHGSLGDFTANGSPIVENVAGMKAVTFDGGSWFNGPTSTAGIEGSGTRTIEVWAYNPAIPGEETIVSWAHRGGPDGTNMSFNYGNNAAWGAVGHWGGVADMGWWGTHSPAPAANKWWHLTYTHDGTATRLYVNGEEESVRDPITLDTYGGSPIRVAAQADGTGAGVDAAFNFTGSIAAVRIHDGVLSPADVQRNYKLGRIKAWNPNPADGALHTSLYASMGWSPGGFAVSHDVYVDDNFEDVDAGTGDAFRINQDSPYFVIGFTGYPFPGGLVPGTTYYWRIDEVNDLHPDSPWRGDVWSFTVPSNKAYYPVPSDDAKYIDTNVTLSWAPGYGAIMHAVYFGEDFETVSNAAGNIPVGLTTYTPDELELGKVYYWRVDELDNTNTYKGDVWSFKTIPDISVSDPNLMGWWKFDEGAGATALDWSGQGNHATLMGGPTWTAGYDGDALKLDGIDDYAELPIGSVISSLSSATFTTWVNFSNVGGAWQRIFDFGSGTGRYIFLCPRSGTDGPMRLAITIGGNAAGEESLIETTDTLPSGWHHVAVVISSGNMQLYLDGVMAISGSTLVVPSDLGQTSSNWLGRSQYSGDGYFNGSLDDFRIYDYVLSADEIVMTMRGDPLLAWDAKPADGTTPDIQVALPLSWSAGEKASQHDVYFGTDADAVDNADNSTPEIYRGRQAGTSYTPPEGVEWGGGPYYWRIDEFNADGTISRGRVWSFTVADFILVEDFEIYDAGENQVWYSWYDGLGYGAPGSDPYYAGNGTGAAVGDETTGSYMEETIVHSGGRSLPFYYDNNKQGYARYSETELTLTSPRDWTIEGVEELSLWFRGYPASVGSFVEGPAGTFTMTGSGADIWYESDQFHYAFKTLTGAGSIIAKVESVSDTDPWAKAGVMIRETLDGGSTHAMMVVTPAQGVSFQRRFETGGASANDDTVDITAPYWVKIERDLAGNFTAYSSANGSTWQMQGQPVPFQMASNAYIGLAVTAHNATATCEAKFSNITITGNVGSLWANQDIGIQSNNAEPLYVAVANAAGNPAVVVHDNPDASLLDTWTEWVIPLQTLADQGISLNNVDRIAIGLGTKGNITTPGGAGKMFIDDIRLYRSRTAAE